MVRLWALGGREGGNMLLYGQPRWGAGRRPREATANGHSNICAARAWRLVRGLDILEFTMGDKDDTTENAPANAGDEAEGFDLVDWCKTHKINRKTEALLRREALDSPEALALLTTQDLYELGLPLGQRKLMQVALSIWQPGNSKNDASGDTSDRPPSDRALGDVQGADGGQEQTISIDGIRRQADALGDAGKAFDTALFNYKTPTTKSVRAPVPDEHGYQHNIHYIIL